MSSPISPALADYRDAIVAAATEVAENSLFAFADTCDEATFTAAVDPDDAGGDPWLRAVIAFTGPIVGRFELSVPEPLARHLGAAFAGAQTPADLAGAEVIDFTGELANMVCGTWLTRACRHEAFSLTPPRVEHCPPGPAKTGDGDSEQFYLAIDEVPIRVELHWGVGVAPAQGGSTDGPR